MSDNTKHGIHTDTNSGLAITAWRYRSGRVNVVDAAMRRAVNALNTANEDDFEYRIAATLCALFSFVVDIDAAPGHVLDERSQELVDWWHDSGRALLKDQSYVEFYEQVMELETMWLITTLTSAIEAVKRDIVSANPLVRVGAEQKAADDPNS